MHSSITVFLACIFLCSSLALQAAPPANDNRGDAEILQHGGAASGTTLEATYEEDDPGPDNSEGNAAEPLSVWYRWSGQAGYHKLVLTYDAVSPVYAQVQARVFRRVLGGGLSSVAVVSFWKTTNTTRQGEARFWTNPGDDMLVVASTAQNAAGPFHLSLAAMTDRAAHDDWEQAGLIKLGQNSFDVTDATRQPGEPSASVRNFPYGELQGTVWKRWVAAEAGFYLAALTSGGYESRIQVFRGSQFPPGDATLGVSGSGSSIFDLDQGGWRISFAAAAGETIYLRAASNSDGPSAITLSPATAGDHFATPLEVGNADHWQKIVPYEHLTMEANEAPGPSGSAWVRWTAPDDARYELQVSRTLDYSNGTPAGLDPVGRIYRGIALNALTPVVSVPLGIASMPLQFRAAAGELYRIQSGLTPLTGWFTSNGGAVGVGGFVAPEFTVSLKRLGYPPANDDFSSAYPLGPGEGEGSGTTVAATSEANESIGLYRSGDTVWHRWAAPAEGGKWEISLGENAFPLILERYRDGLNSDVLTLLTSEDATYDYLRWSVIPSQVYHFRLHGDGYGRQGPYRLRIRKMNPPSNDERAGAFALTGSFPITAGGTTVDAAPEVNEGNPNGYQRGWPTVWWAWTAPSTGWVKVSASGAAVGLVENGEPMRYSLSSVEASAAFRAVQGRSYLVRLAAARGVEGPVSLTMEPALGYDHATLEMAVDLGRAARISSPPYLVNGGGAALASALTSALPEVWYRWTAPHSGWFSVDSEGSSVPVQLKLWSGPPATSSPPVTNAAYPSHWGNQYGDYWPGGVRLPVSRLLWQAVAGQTYYFESYFWGPSSSAAPGLIQTNIQTAGPPPAVDNVQIKVPPHHGGAAIPRWVEILVKIDAPNGFSSGQIQGLPKWLADPPTASPQDSTTFTDANRVFGDAYSGTYRIMAEIQSRFPVIENANLLGLSIADNRGGKFHQYGHTPLPAMSQWSDDTVAPVLESISGLPENVVLGPAPQTFTLCMAISDRGGSGFSEGAIFLTDNSSGYGFLFGGAPRQWPAASITAADRISGDATDGIYEVQLVLPAHTPPPAGGIRFWLRDTAGNRPSYFDFSGAWGLGDGISSPNYSLPLRAFFNQKGSVDTMPPVVSDFHAHYDPATQIIRATCAISDDPSGFHSAGLDLLDANGVVETNLSLNHTHRISGSAAEGQYDISFPLPARGFGQNHYLRLTAHDASGLSRQVFSSTFSLPDRTSADQRAPRLAHFTISPGAVDLRTEPATVHISLGANDDRPGITGTLFIIDSARKILARMPVNCPTTFLACDVDVLLPQRAYPGPALEATVFLILQDAAGRTVTYGQPHSPAWPTPVALRIQSEKPDVLTQWASSFPGYSPNPAAVNMDTDGDGTADLIEFTLGTDPTQRSVAFDHRPYFNVSPDVRFPVSLPPDVDPRSHRLPTLFQSAAFSPLLGIDPDASPWVTFSYIPNPRMETAAWKISPWRLKAESSSDLATWKDASVPSPTRDNEGRINILTPATPASLWFRLRLDGRP